ncbi:hypothetical protein [Sorangium cellulosum]|uniref:hypothetical protein n=1 Tax=Sorangium cellulosum TaxID=56 RepID=UPI0010138D1B|nr:hypothetical protein [Sorangium cellulosum]
MISEQQRGDREVPDPGDDPRPRAHLKQHLCTAPHDSPRLFAAGPGRGRSTCCRLDLEHGPGDFNTASFARAAPGGQFAPHFRGSAWPLTRVRPTSLRALLERPSRRRFSRVDPSASTGFLEVRRARFEELAEGGAVVAARDLEYVVAAAARRADRLDHAARARAVRIGQANAFRNVKILGAAPDSCSPTVRAH